MKILNECFKRFPLDQKTVSAADVLLEMYLVASYYSGLTNGLLNPKLKPPYTMYKATTLAARKAHGVYMYHSSKSKK